jgi:hypothetical protein
MKTLESDDGIFSWVAEFPSFKGCGGAGDTPDEAVRDAFNNVETNGMSMNTRSYSPLL